MSRTALAVAALIAAATWIIAARGKTRHPPSPCSKRDCSVWEPSLESAARSRSFKLRLFRGS